MQLVSY